MVKNKIDVVVEDGLIDCLFPDAILPGPVDDIYTGITTGEHPLYSSDRKLWINCPELTRQSDDGDQEEALAAFFTTVTRRISEVVGKPCNRVITGAYATTKNPLPRGPGGGRRPEIVIFENSGGEPQTWKTVMSHWELKNNAKPKAKKEAAKLVADGVELIYGFQYSRRFVASLSILGYQITLHINDRAGEVLSKPFDMHADPHAFLRVLTAFMFASKEYLGFDPSLRLLEDGYRAVVIANKEYVIEQWICTSGHVQGRGTSCWRATRGGVTYAIKDYWTNGIDWSSEAELLKEARGIEGVCQLVDEEVVMFQGKIDSTDLVRPSIAGNRCLDAPQPVYCWTHRRLVLDPFAIPITYFETKKELVGAFIDTIKGKFLESSVLAPCSRPPTAHKTLLEEAKILHRDISINNIMLVDSKDSTNRRRGILIDFDTATRYNNGAAESNLERKPGETEWIGTKPFMAIELLAFGDKYELTYTPEWDLESYFYVFVWICVLYDGPNNSKRDINFEETMLRHWTNGDFETVGVRKSAAVKDGIFWRRLIAEVSPYFEELKPCLERWRGLLFDSESKTHRAVLSVLDEVYESLPDQEPCADVQSGEETSCSESENDKVDGEAAAAFQDTLVGTRTRNCSHIHLRSSIGESPTRKRPRDSEESDEGSSRCNTEYGTFPSSREAANKGSPTLLEGPPREQSSSTLESEHGPRMRGPSKRLRREAETSTDSS
ncbi:hypothetical protein GLOTRDRAFT_131507 [Gloeophyllum trabeum ATCC 11539]|uniref:Protein kinase domain-containing protein n=1 Tax=Gloeophyllum trabeum (strain ATCC 11539 / FP-39264 / Madison 617) TaxID=670483 RepID=S7Q141_GLOTA|nr:uncharacterized protein GLOTRDRAFT_131507 [Gloeophyllum trabeum ATCC 11539]EPQ53232.1 hypothetical protein GLOTRDRAFT_131507 [Gloeophyllum trabeum ATCC 11539]